MTRAQQAQQTRRRVVDTARRLFSERGYDATSLQDVADAMGVRKANVYYYFKTKDAILTEMLTEVTAPMSALLAALTEVTDAEERRRRLIHGFARETVRSYRAHGTMNLGDPALLREPGAGAILEGIADGALAVLFGASPTPDERAAFWLVVDLAPVLRRLDDLTDEDLQDTVERLLLRVLDVA